MVPISIFFLQFKLFFFSCEAANLITFDLLRTKICVTNTFGEQFKKEKSIKIEKFKMAVKAGYDGKFETNSFIMIAFDLLNMKIFVYCEVDVKISLK